MKCVWFFLCALELTLIWSLLFSACFLLMLECHVTSLLFLQWFLPSTCLLGWCCASFCLSHQDGIVADESQNLQFMSSQSLKLPPSNSALPNQALGSIAGLGMQNLNSVRQVSPRVYFRLSVEWFVEAISSFFCVVTVFKSVVRCGNELWALKSTGCLFCRMAIPVCLVLETQQHNPGACSSLQHNLSAHLSLISVLKCLLHYFPLRLINFHDTPFCLPGEEPWIILYLNEVTNWLS